MSKKTRRIILSSAIIFFILVAPAILLYSWGYSFDWQNKKPVLTGGLYLKSIPENVDIFINDKLIKQETPAFIKRLLPKEYQIKITKQGYYPWQKNLKVESKLVTEARNIFLIPMNSEIKIVKQDLPQDFSLTEYIDQKESNNVFYIQKPSYILYKTDKNNSFQEQINLTPLPANQDYQIFASANEQIALLSDEQELYLFSERTRNFELISRDVQNIRFSNDSKKLLYFTPNELWVYYLASTPGQPNKNTGDRELITRLSQKIKHAAWYGKNNQHIIFIVGKNIKITELDGRGQRNTVDLIKMDIQALIYSPKDEKIYLIKDNDLLSVSLE